MELELELKLGKLLVEVVRTFEVVVHMQMLEGELSTYELAVQVVLHKVVQMGHSLLPVY